MRLEQGTEVRVDIPDRTDPDFEQYHRRCGTIVAIVEDEASELTGDARDDPAIVYQPPEFAVTLLIFSTGKVIVGGTTDREVAGSTLQIVERKIATLNEV